MLSFPGSVPASAPLLEFDHGSSLRSMWQEAQLGYVGQPLPRSHQAPLEPEHPAYPGPRQWIDEARQRVHRVHQVGQDPKGRQHQLSRVDRCGWCGTDPLYVAYHDDEWGVAAHDDRQLFEMLTLEGAQAGLSWLTILRKRDAYREAFANFDVDSVAQFSPARVDQLLGNAGIIRNRLKITSTITNATAVITIRDEFGSLNSYLWSFVGGAPIRNDVTDYRTAPAKTALSDEMSKALLKRGFKFVGSTIMYAFMQATGMVNDHEQTCWKR